MILAFDEGAWHPSENLIYLWGLVLVVSVVSQFLLARGGPRRLAHYAGIAAPLLALFVLNLYIGYGTTGSYAGRGVIGLGAHTDMARTLPAAALQLAFLGPPMLVAVLLAHWNWLRIKLPAVFWVALLLAFVAELLVGVLLIAVLLET